jgi:hypothetical protein
MSCRDQRGFKAARAVLCWSYPAATAAFVIGSVNVVGFSFEEAQALRLPGETTFGYVSLLFLSAFGLLLLGCLWFLVNLFRRRFSCPNIIGLALVVGGFCAPSIIHSIPGRSYIDGVKIRLSPVDEVQYLHFAEEVRAAVSKQKKGNEVSFDLDYMVYSDPAVRVACERILEESPLAIWPKRFLSVRVEKDSVVLSRGASMLGQIGVMIFDKGPLRQPQGPDHPRPNSYFPVEYRLTDKVFVFTID